MPKKKGFLRLIAIMITSLFLLSALSPALLGEDSFDEYSDEYPDEYKPGPNEYRIDESTSRFLGRTYDEEGIRYFNWINSGFEIRFRGTGVHALLTTNKHDDKEGRQAYISVYVDGRDEPADAIIIRLDKGEKEWYTLVEGLDEGEHTITVRKRNANIQGGNFMIENIASKAGVELIRIDGEGLILEPPKPKTLKLEAIGDSITNGSGIYQKSDKMPGEDGWSTYAAFAARELDADLNTIAISGMGLICSIFGGKLMELPLEFPYVDRYNNKVFGASFWWDYEQYQSDVVIINLGTNDRAGVGPKESGKRYSYREFEDEYVRFMLEIKEAYPNCRIVPMLGAMGAEDLFVYIKRAAIRVNGEVGEEFVFPLWVSPDPTRDGKSGDGSHPSLAAHKRYGRQLAAHIRKILGIKK